MTANHADLNSITQYDQPDTAIDTIMMQQSNRKDICLVVEGEDDASFFSNVFGLPSSCIIPARGKEYLMEMFADAASTASFSGSMFFFRDADFDELQHLTQNGVSLFVTDHYDFEMSLLKIRLFRRIFSEYIKSKPADKILEMVSEAWHRALTPASTIGSLKKHSYINKMPVKFKDMKFDFVGKDGTINTKEFLRYITAYSKLPTSVSVDLKNGMIDILKSAHPEKLCSGKDVLQILSKLINRYYKCCDSKESSYETLTRMLWIGAVQDDLRQMSFYNIFKEQVEVSHYKWQGHDL